jgi:hypothetical protein
MLLLIAQPEQPEAQELHERVAEVEPEPDERPSLDAAAFHQARPDERDPAALTYMSYGYMSYGGRWSLADEVVTHRVAFALFPNWVGTELVRDVAWDGDQLILTGAPDTWALGKVVVHRLVWERAPAADLGKRRDSDNEWTVRDSNPRPPARHAGALTN